MVGEPSPGDASGEPPERRSGGAEGETRRLLYLEIVDALDEIDKAVFDYRDVASGLQAAVWKPVLTVRQ